MRERVCVRERAGRGRGGGGRGGKEKKREGQVRMDAMAHNYLSRLVVPSVSRTVGEEEERGAAVRDERRGVQKGVCMWGRCVGGPSKSNAKGQRRTSKQEEATRQHTRTTEARGCCKDQPTKRAREMNIPIEPGLNNEDEIEKRQREREKRRDGWRKAKEKTSSTSI